MQTQLNSGSRSRSFGTFQDEGSSEQIIKPRRPKLRDVLPQIVASCISLCAVPQVGLNLAFSGVLIPQLAKDPDIIGFDKESASWVASLLTITMPIGSLFAGYLMDSIGRKRTCILLNLPILAGWAFIYFAKTELWPIYVGRVLCGLGVGMTNTGLVYTAEVAHSSYRSMLLSLNGVNNSFGILLTTNLGVYLDWHTCALLFGALAVVSLVLSFFIPESPYWLVNFTSTPKEEVGKHVRWLNRPQWLFDEEWERLEEARAKQKTIEEYELRQPKSTIQKSKEKITVFFERASIKPLTVLLMIFFFQQATGTYVVIFYTVNIFRSLGGGFGFGIDEYTATSSLGVLKFLMSIAATVVSKFVGRRPIMMVSSVVMGLACITTAAGLYLNGITTVEFGGDGGNDNVTSHLDETVSPIPTESAPGPTNVPALWILFFLLVFVAAGSIGQMAVPWTLMGELLPTKIRASGSSLIFCYSSLLQFVVIKTFPGLLDYATLPFLFVTYSVITFISVVYVYIFLPETFRKNFVEIARNFEKKNENNPNNGHLTT